MSVPVTSTLTVPVVSQPAGTTVVSVGPAASTWTIWVFQSDSLPTASMILVLSVCVPCWVRFRVTPLAAGTDGLLSTWYTTLATPECGSAPVTVTLALLCCQPTGAVVLSVGTVSSIRIVCGFSLRLPAASTAAVVSVHVPEPVTSAVSFSVQGPAPIRHSPWTGETRSLMSSGTVTGPRRQVDDVPVSLTGEPPSIRTVCSSQSLQFKPSKARCVSV